MCSVLTCGTIQHVDKQLTPSELRTLRATAKLIAQGRSTSQLAIANSLGLLTVVHHLRSLRALGLVTWANNLRCSTVITPAGERLLERLSALQGAAWICPTCEVVIAGPFCNRCLTLAAEKK